MERNIDYKKEFDLACEKLAKQEKKIEKLKELRAYADNLDSENDNLVIEIEELKKENRKLKEEKTEILKEMLRYQAIAKGVKMVEEHNAKLEKAIEVIKIYIGGKDSIEKYLNDIQ